MSEQQALGARLRAAREAAGMSQGQVARAIGLHRPSITNIEQGRRDVSFFEAVELARLYGISLSVLQGNAGQSQGMQDDPGGRLRPRANG